MRTAIATMIAILSVLSLASPAYANPDGPNGTVWLDFLAGAAITGSWEMDETDYDDSISGHEYGASLGVVTGDRTTLEISLLMNKQSSDDLATITDGYSAWDVDLLEKTVWVRAKFRVYLTR